MDLPTCPTCNQSVLDEDAETCPFCGASMSGKPSPGGAPKPTAAAPKLDKPAAPAAAEAKKKSAPDDSVIESDGAAAKAIPVRRKRTKGLVLRVRCPMCEDEGWVPAKAAGRNVRCANKECLVPVFTAPALPKKAEPQPEESKSSALSWPVVAIVAVGLVAVGLGFATEWRFFLVPKVEVPKGGWDDIPTAGGGNGGQTDPDDPDGQPPVPPVTETKSVADVRKEVLERMTRLSGNTPLRFKPRARGVVVSAHARAGDVDGAVAELSRLEQMADVAKIDQVDALVEVAWAELAAGETESANRRAEKALGFVEENRLPGRTIGQAIGNLSALLFVLGRAEDATSVTTRDPNAAIDRALALAEVQARASGSFDVDLEFRLSTLSPNPNHATLMVVAQLADHDQWQAAFDFARTRGSDDEKAECLTLLAELLASWPLNVDGPKTDEVLAALDEPNRAAAEARVAARRLTAGSGEAIPEALVARAVGSPGEVATLPAPNVVLEVSHGFAVRRPEKTLAAAAMGRALAVQAELAEGGDAAPAWRAYQAALGHAGQFAPPLKAVTTHRALASRGPVEGIAPTRMTDYQIRVEQLEQVARAGFELKAAVLLDAATNGLADEVWAHLQAESFEESPTAMLTTPLGLVLQANGSEATRKAVTAALESADGNLPFKQAAIAEPGLLLADDATPAAVAKTLSAGRGPEADTAAVRVACRLRRGPQGRERSVAFLKSLSSKLVAAEAATFVQAATSRGLAADRAWVELDEGTNFDHVVAVAACEGLLLALESAVEEPVPAVATDEK